MTSDDVSVSTRLSSDKHSGSFRDPCGFVFIEDGVLYRQVNRIYQPDYDHLMKSGLYAALVKADLLIPHEEVPLDHDPAADAYKRLRPEAVPFISYPYEWCFSQLQDAALATLAVQKKAFAHGMTLKDASAYNIQFLAGKPKLIDTLSFERYREGQIWYGYRQFCQHFLAPLALMHYRDVRLNQLSRIMIDGIDLDLAAKLLPWRSKWRFSLLTHIHLHAAGQRRYADQGAAVKSRKMSKLGFQGLIDSLESAVKKLSWQPGGTTWSDYYDDTNYTSQAMTEKEKRVQTFMEHVQPQDVWDLGANDGRFSRLAGAVGVRTISFDMDPSAVEKNYRQCQKDKQTNVLPLALDLSNPSGGIGWDNAERQSLAQRGPCDCILALALIHHLAISNNVPLEHIAAFLAKLGQWLIIEWVPKEDSQVQRLLAGREDIFTGYTQAMFETCFQKHFTLHETEPITESKRTLYLMEKR